MKNYKLQTGKLLFTILLIGIALRLFQLGTESIWTDEIWSLYHAQKPGFSELTKSVVDAEGAPFGHYLFLHYWINFFGNSEFALRFPSVLFGVLSILLVYKLGEMLFSKKVGLISAFMMSTSMIQVQYSQEARLYALFNFLALLSMYFLLRMQKTKPTSSSIGYVITSVLMFYVNYLAIFVIIIEVLYLFHKKLLKKYVLNLFFVFMFCLLLIPQIIQQFALRNPILQRNLYLRGFPFPQLGIVYLVLPVLFIVLLMIVLYVIIRRLPTEYRKMMQLSRKRFMVLLIILCLCYLFSLRLTIHSFAPLRHSMFLLPLLYFFIAYKIEKTKLIPTAIIIISIVNLFALAVYYSTTTKVQWREASSFIPESAELILFDGSSETNRMIFDYYHPSDYRRLNVRWLEEGKMEQIGETKLKGALAGEKTAWFILYQNPRRNSAMESEYLEIMKSQYAMDKKGEFYGVNVYHFQLR